MFRRSADRAQPFSRFLGVCRIVPRVIYPESLSWPLAPHCLDRIHEAVEGFVQDVATVYFSIVSHVQPPTPNDPKNLHDPIDMERQFHLRMIQSSPEHRPERDPAGSPSS